MTYGCTLPRVTRFAPAWPRLALLTLVQQRTLAYAKMKMLTLPGHVYNFEMQMVHQITGGCGQDLTEWTERQSFSLSAAGWRSACIYL